MATGCSRSQPAQQRVALGEQRGPVGQAGQRVVARVVRHLRGPARPAACARRRRAARRRARRRTRTPPARRGPPAGSARPATRSARRPASPPTAMVRVITGPGSPAAAMSWPGASLKYRFRPPATMHLDLHPAGPEDVAARPAARPAPRRASTVPGRVGVARGERLPDPAFLLGAQMIPVGPLQQPQRGREDAAATAARGSARTARTSRSARCRRTSAAWRAAPGRRSAPTVASRCSDRVSTARPNVTAR